MMEALGEQEKEEVCLSERAVVRAKRPREKEVTVGDSELDELTVVKTKLSTIDPITMKQMIDPVCNQKRNHIYQKLTLYSMIKQVILTTPLCRFDSSPHQSCE